MLILVAVYAHVCAYTCIYMYVCIHICIGVFYILECRQELFKLGRLVPKTTDMDKYPAPQSVVAVADNLQTYGDTVKGP